MKNIVTSGAPQLLKGTNTCLLNSLVQLKFIGSHITSGIPLCRNLKDKRRNYGKDKSRNLKDKTKRYRTKINHKLDNLTKLSLITNTD